MIEENYNGVTYRLVTEDEMQPVSLGDAIVNFRDEETTLKNAACPRHEASTGRVNGYYPSVYGLRWVEVLDYNVEFLDEYEDYCNG